MYSASEGYGFFFHVLNCMTSKNPVFSMKTAGLLRRGREIMTTVLTGVIPDRDWVMWFFFGRWFPSSVLSEF